MKALATLALFVILALPASAQSDDGRPTTPEELESWKRVAATYPDIGRPASATYVFVQTQIKDFYKTDPNFFEQKNWPEMLAVRYATQLQALKSSGDPMPAVTPSPMPQTDIGDAIALSKARMNAKYADLNQPDSALYKNVVLVIEYLKKTRPTYFQKPDWPEKIVEGVVLSMAQSAEQAAATSVAQSDPAPPQEPPQPTQYNGRPLPSNWIDPRAADAQWQMEELQRQISSANAAAQQAVQQSQQNQSGANATSW